MLRRFPTGLVAVVSDSYDIYAACKDLWGTELRDQVLARDGVLIVRPDSGDPKVVLPRVLEILGDRFGVRRNEKGFRVLNPKVRVIQGDGIDRQSIREILFSLRLAGWSADNLAFGSGGGLLQQVDRDTLRFAFKCSAVEVAGQWRDVRKAPVTDPSKRSKAGRLRLARDGEGRFVTHTDLGRRNELIEVFRDGAVTHRYDFEEIRARAHAPAEHLAGGRVGLERQREPVTSAAR
jgi:nicotinamide phosphoribosyltransferase